MPHSSSGFGEILIDRFYVVERELAKEGSDKKLSLEGQESSPPAPLALVTFLHGQVAAMEEGKLIPVTFRDKDERNGYYAVASTTSELIDYQNEAKTATWTIELDRIGSDSEIDIQTRLTGAVRSNDFSLTGEKWHAPARGHYAYYTGSTLPSSMTRTLDDGNAITVYRNIPDNIAPKWGCPVASYKNGRVKALNTSISGTENEVEGINQSLPPTGWTLNNGLVNVSPTATAGVLAIGNYTGSSYQTVNWSVQVNGSNVAAFQSATLLRNDFEQVVLRLVCNTSTGIGRTTLDLILRRGSRFVEGYLQTSSSTTLKIRPTTGQGSTNSPSGVVVQSTGTHRSVSGSAHTFTPDGTNGGLSIASTRTLDFWIGMVINGASAQSGDTATHLRDQYIGCMAEITYGVRR